MIITIITITIKDALAAQYRESIAWDDCINGYSDIPYDVLALFLYNSCNI